MWQYLAKLILSALVIASVSEMAKRSPLWAGLLASLPLTSILALVWLYWETGDSDQIIHLSQSIFWFVLPSLSFFLILPALLRTGFGFWLSLVVSSLLTAITYAVMTWLLSNLVFKS